MWYPNHDWSLSRGHPNIYNIYNYMLTHIIHLHNTSHNLTIAPYIYISYVIKLYLKKFVSFQFFSWTYRDQENWQRVYSSYLRTLCTKEPTGILLCGLFCPRRNLENTTQQPLPRGIVIGWSALGVLLWTKLYWCHVVSLSWKALFSRPSLEGSTPVFTLAEGKAFRFWIFNQLISSKGFTSLC